MNDRTRRSSRLTGIIAIAAFALFLVAPSIQQTLNVPNIPPVVESRARVPVPDGNPFFELWSSPGYFSAYERHFNDIFGYRNFFIRLRNQIQYSLFNDSDQIIVGRDNWLIDRSSVQVQQVSVDSVTDAQWDRLAKRIAAFKKLLADRGISLVVLPIPLKNTIYPEHFPDQAARRPAMTGEAKFQALLTRLNVPFVDVYSLLTTIRQQKPVFYRTDIHWNDVGASAASADLVRQVAGMTHSPVRWRNIDRFDERPFVGGDKNSLATFWSPVDMEPFAVLPEERCGEFVDEKYGKVFHNRCAGPLLPPMTMFGNSFMLMLAPVGLQDYFSAMHRRLDYTEFAHVFSEMPSDTKILVWQIFELEIGYQLQDDAYWRGVDRASARHRSGP